MSSKSFADGLRPDPPLTVSEWADKYRMLSSESSAEPGRWRTSRTPYLRAIMDAFTPSHPARKITFLKGAQIGGTEAINNCIGYTMHYAPSSMLVVEPNDDMVEKVSKQRLSPMIESTPALKDKISKDNINEKHYPGGILMMTSANSSAGLRSMPVPIVLCDEVDEFSRNLKGQGNVIQLVEARTRTYPNRKVFICSTPTIDGSSQVMESYLESNQMEYHVPCPECGCMSFITWSRIKWEKGKPETVHYECPDCMAQIPESKKSWMLENGSFIAQNPNADPTHYGFRVNGLYSPVGWYSWEQSVRDFLDAKKEQSKFIVFVNTVLGETWKVRGETPAWQSIYDRREGYPLGQIPDCSAEVLTAGVDVQKDRIEVEVVAWGPGLESWSIDHHVLYGDPYYSDIWGQLTDVLQTRVPHAGGGSVPISLMAVDSGFATTEVYKWARSHPSDRVMVVKGSATERGILGGVSHKKEGIALWNIGVNTLKSELYGLLKLRPNVGEVGQIESYPAGFCHFPMYGQEFFEQLASEKQILETDRRGRQKLAWVQDRARNEALDLRNYARAAAERLRIAQYEDRHWHNLKKERLRSNRAGGIITPDNRTGHRQRRESTWL